jgi:hypothetical protein
MFRRDDNIKTVFKALGCEIGDTIELIQDRIQ